MFPDAKGTAESLAEQFLAEGRETIISPGMGHNVAQDPELIERLVNFAKRHI